MNSERIFLEVGDDTYEVAKKCLVSKEESLQIVDLGVLLVSGKIHQKIGNEYQPISLYDIKPLPKINQFTQKLNLLKIEVGAETLMFLQQKGIENVVDWLSRSTALRLVIDHIDYYMDYGRGWEKIEF